MRVGRTFGVSMTRIERQEETGKLRLRPRKVLLAGLAVGVIFFFVSRGIPWFSSEIPDAAMGRPLFNGLPEQGGFIKAVGVHFLLALGYALIIAAFVFRLDPLPASITGGVIGLGLYGLNYLIFRFALASPAVSELPVAITHVAFGLALAGAYKAISVRRIIGQSTPPPPGM